MKITGRVAAKAAKDGVRTLLEQVEDGGRIEITVRGKPVAIVGPVSDLTEEEVARAEQINTRAIREGKRNFSGVVLRGPYVITRNGERVASVRAPAKLLDEVASRSLSARTIETMERQVSLLEELNLLKPELAQMRKLIQAGRKALTALVAKLEPHDPETANALRRSLKEIEDGLEGA